MRGRENFTAVLARFARTLNSVGRKGGRGERRRNRDGGRGKSVRGRENFTAALARFARTRNSVWRKGGRGERQRKRDEREGEFYS